MESFDSLFNCIVDKIANGCEISREQISSALAVSEKETQSNFSIFFNKISESPTETAKKVFDYFDSNKFEEITDLKLKNTNVSFSLNMKLYYSGIYRMINKKDCDYGRSIRGDGETVVIDYSSPNVAKLFHVGHYRTTILGNFIKNLMNFAGYKAISLNYLGDWGKQFGLVLLGFEKYGNEEELKKDALMHLFQIYVKINADAKEDPKIHDEAREIFRAMEEDKNEEYLSKWRAFREISIEKFKQLYKKLNVTFDVYSGESFYTEAAVSFANENKISVQDEDGSKYIDCGKLGKALIRKSDGTTLYVTRDICAAVDRIKTFNPSRLIYVVSDEQNLHFSQLFECMSKLGYDKKMFQHVNYGKVYGMSTRKGNVFLLEDIIEASCNAIKSRVLSREMSDTRICDESLQQNVDKTAYILAISTLLVADFEAKRIKGYTFDADQRANCDKGSGAYLQYAHCRLLGIERMNSSIDLSIPESINLSLIENDDFISLSYKLLWFERVLSLTLEDFEPSRIVSYIMDIASKVNNVISKYKVKGEDVEVAKARLYAFRAARITIRNCLLVLGMEPLNKM